MEKYKAFLLMSVLSALTACGGGSSSSDNATDPDPEPIKRTGVFLDSPVGNIGYRTETLAGVTTPQGEYEYVEGETVTFFIGDLVFPSVVASGVVTPADIASEDGTLKTNILQVLQTLDSDGIADNGITIREDSAAAFIGTEFDLSDEGFDSEVTATLIEIDEDLSLVDESTANAHFEASLESQILGSWLYEYNVLTFIEGNKYIIIHRDADTPVEPGSQKAGSVEYGSYTWDVNNGAFNVTLIGESDGWGGLYDNGSYINHVAVEGNSLVLKNDNNSVTFSRVINDSNPLIGGWLLSHDDGIVAITFLSESEYSLAHSNNDRTQQYSGEFGTYQLNGNDFKVLSASVDTDEDSGFYNATNPSDQDGETLVVNQSTITFTDQSEGAVNAERIGVY